MSSALYRAKKALSRRETVGLSPIRPVGKWKGRRGEHLHARGVELSPIRPGSTILGSSVVSGAIRLLSLVLSRLAVSHACSCAARQCIPGGGGSSSEAKMCARPSDA